MYIKKVDNECNQFNTPLSQEADGVLKKVKTVESKCMNNEVTLEELDKNLRYGYLLTYR